MLINLPYAVRVSVQDTYMMGWSLSKSQTFDVNGICEEV